MGDERGHRAIPHTADVILEAWAPDVAGCLEEAVAALASTYGEVDDGTALTARTVEVPPGQRETQLLDLLDEVIFALDTAEGVPVAADVRQVADGSLQVVLRLVPLDRVAPTGSVPKGISRSELELRDSPKGVSCRFLVDV
jgi:SHS2 domain-containing protein